MMESKHSCKVLKQEQTHYITQSKTCEVHKLSGNANLQQAVCTMKSSRADRPIKV